MAPRFSIVIPTFNRSHLFPHAVRSVLNQTFEDFEVIVSDNCSTDDTAKAARQFADPRFKYVRTPRHMTISDSCEFARKQASGRLIMLFSDDDALLDSALARFAAAAEEHQAEFLCCSVAEYRDVSYPGADKNTVRCRGFAGRTSVLSSDEFIRPLFALRPRVDMHPSAFVFPKRVADSVEARTGRFFWTNGVEYSALPITAALAKRLVHLDVPLTILGRTDRSWGTNIGLCNPGKEKIQELIDDVDHMRRHVPLSNFTATNMIAEGMLTAKQLFPDEFSSYEFDEPIYLRNTMRELTRRRAMGVDVSAEIEETLRYSSKYPSLRDEFSVGLSGTRRRPVVQLVRAGIGRLGARKISERIQVLRLKKQLKAGRGSEGFAACGDDFGFSNIVECSEFLARCVLSPTVPNLEAVLKTPA